MNIGNSNRVIRYTKIEDGAQVSTIFLGIDHSFNEGAPILFETMVFDGDYNGWQVRYSTYDEAIKGHELACKMVKMGWIRRKLNQFLNYLSGIFKGLFRKRKYSNNP